jgi:hypothetical protein
MLLHMHDYLIYLIHSKQSLMSLPICQLLPVNRTHLADLFVKLLDDLLQLLLNF